jgi:Protein of unknown function (DUF2914)
MSEKKNIVIKVKYPSPGTASAKSSSQPGVITEWNYQRIGFALGSVLLALMAFFFFSGNGDEPVTTDNTQLAVPKQQPETTVAQSEKLDADSKQAPPAKALEQPKFESSKAVARAQLTSDINKNEPVDKLKLPLKIGKKETLWIYYFVELKGMKGKAVFHEWWLNGNLVSRKKVNISDETWRTASKQLITYTNYNDWIVRVVDESRNKLSETSFSLELKSNK